MIFKESKQYRLPGYNYANDGFYFVTICTKNMEMVFGDVVNGQMILSEIGKIANEYWLEIPKHFPHVKLDEYVIMPNHVHGVLEIDWNGTNNVGTGQCPVPTGSKFGRVTPKSLSTIVGSFKSIVTKTVNIEFPNTIFGWQPRFRDTIIRDDQSLYNIRQYIIDNPENWGLKKNLKN